MHSICVGLLLLGSGVAGVEPAGFLHKDGQTLFPIGFYELPRKDPDLKRMAASGVNLVRCGSRAELDRVKAAGLLGWIPLYLSEGPTDSLRRRVLELRNHPALAVWEGPDEIVWTFTAYSVLKRTAGFTREEWYGQKPKAVAYASREGGRILPQLKKAAALVHELDQHGRPVWINEAAESDAIFVRQYMDAIDITGCDTYPISETRRNVLRSGQYTDRWRMVGRDKPVWMVLQGHSPHAATPEFHHTPAYPTFSETRFMAYDAIVHGARGILYWGSESIDQPAFRSSLYALTAELAAIQPFLVAPSVEETRLRLVESDVESRPQHGVRMAVRREGDEWLILLVNEDPWRHLCVEVSGLEALNGRTLQLLYGDEPVLVAHGELMTRMQGNETKVFATSNHWETPQRIGRDFK